MTTQTVYVGPLRFEIEYGEGCSGLAFPEIFERKTVEVRKMWRVRMEPCSDIAPPLFFHYESSGFCESIQDKEINRYVYQEIDGVKRYYAKSTIQGDFITIKINFHAEMVFGRSMEIWRFMMLEKLFARENALILHSASVLWNGKAVLFSAPSGTGKSTQVELWKKYINGVSGINGDRNLLYHNNGQWFVCGFPWHGTSADCVNKKAPLAAIAIIRQSKTDSIRELDNASKIKCIYSELSLNNWDVDFTNHTVELLDALIREVSIVQLNCTMDESAVQCLKERLERGGPTCGTL